MSGPRQHGLAVSEWGATTPQFEVVEFPSDGVILRGRLYRGGSPEDPAPAVAMAVGFTATITMVPWYAEAFAAAGLTVLAFDHAAFGLSDGEPRLEVDLWRQARGYLDALAYLRGLGEIDSDRVGIWGASSSAHVGTIAAAVDGRVGALIAQAPSWGDELAEQVPDDAEFERLEKALRQADYVDWPRTIIGPMPVVSLDQEREPSFARPATAYRWYMQFATAPGTGWENRATFVDVDSPVPLDVQLCIPHLRAPTLVIAAHDDEMPGSDGQVARALASRLQGPSEVLMHDGGHLATFHPESSQFQAAVEAGRSFLLRRLGRVGVT